MMRKMLHITLFSFSLTGAVFAETLALPPQPEAPSEEPVPAPETTQAVPAPEEMPSEAVQTGEAVPAEETPAPTKTFTPPPPAPVATDGSYSITLPGRGMTMEQVEAKFGTPSEKFPEVGDPPIIRWNYPGFTVYFEYQFVINAVASLQAAPSQ